MKYQIILIVLFILLTLGTVSANDNNNSTELDVNSQTEENNFSSTILADDLTKYYGDDTRFSATFLNYDGTPLVNTTVSFNINGVSYNRNTDLEGIAGLNINLNPGNYTIISSSPNGDSLLNNITILSTLDSHDLTKYFRNSSQYEVLILDSHGNPLINSDVLFNINGVFYERQSNSEGIARLNINLNPGEYIITTYHPNGERISNFINVLSIFESSQDVVMYYRNGSQYSVRVLDDNGNPLINSTILFNINGVFYNRITDNNGIARLAINLNPNSYIITAEYNGLRQSNIIQVLSKSQSEDITITYADLTNFQVHILDNHGNNAVNELVSFNINGFIYENITDNNGIAHLNVNLNAGHYTVTVFSQNNTFDSKSNLINVNNRISLTTYDWSTGGDLSRNSLIYNNVPDSELLREVIRQANSGTPLITVSGGIGRSVFMVAGVHGSELSSQVAMMNLINYLESNPVSGTVYIIPFVAPSMTAENTRYFNGINLNSVANVAGTPTNNILNLAINLGVDALGDFHCTRPGGDPGDNVAMGTYAPLRESANMAQAIASATGFTPLIYSQAGLEYEGALEDCACLNGIPAVTCEVVTPHGSIASGSVDRSFSMMIAFLEYNGLF